MVNTSPIGATAGHASRATPTGANDKPILPHFLRLHQCTRQSHEEDARNRPITGSNAASSLAEHRSPKPGVAGSNPASRAGSLLLGRSQISEIAAQTTLERLFGLPMCMQPPGRLRGCPWGTWAAFVRVLQAYCTGASSVVLCRPVARTASWMHRVHYRLSEAATAFGVSRDTLKRRLREGAFPNARRHGGKPNAPWIIPHDDLAAAGFVPAPPGSPSPEPRSGHECERRLDALDRQVASLQAEMRELRSWALQLRAEDAERRNEELVAAIQLLARQVDGKERS